jgi:hypothetical protein
MSEKTFRLGTKEIAALIAGTLLALAAMAISDPLVFFPCFGGSWMAFVVLCILNKGARLWRFVLAVIITVFLSFVAWRAYHAAQRNDSVLRAVLRFVTTTSPSPTDELRQFRDQIIESSSADSGAKLSALHSKASESAKDEEAATKREKEILQHEPLSLDSLEKARQQNEKKLEAERQQAELAKQEQEINREKQQKAFQKDFAAREQRFAAPFIPCVDYAVTALYEMLQSISPEPIISDFPGSRPSIYNSVLFKDGRFIDGEHIIRVGAHKEWEFHVVTSGNSPMMGGLHKYFGFEIRAGTASMGIGNQYRQYGNWNPANSDLRISCGAEGKDLYSEKCSFSEYQKPIQAALRQLIQSCYNHCRLTRNPTPLSPTPNTGASPH